MNVDVTPCHASRISRFRRGVAFLSVLLACAATATVVRAVPGEATSLYWCAGSETCLQWSSVPTASRYAVYRGTGAQLPLLLSPVGGDSCDRMSHVSGTTAGSLVETPATGGIFWYLVVAENTCGQGPAGSATAGSRVLNPSGPCQTWCTDAALNGDETDQDCGGPSCGACGDGKACFASSDCASRRCVTGHCQAASCSDGISNGGETGVDCGGPCGSCANGQGCCAGADCQSGNCSGDICQARANGATCTLGSQCQSGSCVDGVCCNTTCTGSCQACSAAKKGGGTDGTCGTIGNGLDPDNECAGTSACNGTGSCAAANGGSCFSPVQCLSGICVDQVCCDTTCNGSCQACTATKKGTGSDGTCGNILNGRDPDNECQSAAVCNGSGACIFPDGATCTSGSSCISGNCVDGVCCNSACTGTCQGCNAARTGSASGFCTNITSGIDPDNECPGNAFCSAGACVAPNGTSCTVGAQCSSGNCVDGFCCNNPCSGACQACSAAKKGGGTDGSCGQISPNTDPDDECAGTAVCSAVGTCVSPNGTACTVAGTCQSGNCVDGVCCNSTCATSCSACTAAKKGGGADGSCGFIAAGTDPDNECPGTANCAGNGFCTP